MNDELAKALEQTRVIFEEWEKEYHQNADGFWNSLSKEDQLKCFYSICKRIHKGDMEDKGSYRYVLYDVFGFGTEAYAIGMNCGYMAIHNAIFTAKEDKNDNQTGG